MPRVAKELSARAVSQLGWSAKSIDKQGNPIPTWHPVGGATGLYLQCTKMAGDLGSIVTQASRVTACVRPFDKLVR